MDVDDNETEGFAPMAYYPNAYPNHGRHTWPDRWVCCGVVTMTDPTPNAEVRMTPRDMQQKEESTDA